MQHTNCFQNNPSYLLSYHLRSSSFEITAFEITNLSTIPVDVLKQEMAQKIKQKSPGTTEIHFTKCVSSKGVQFKNGMIVAHGSASELPNFGEIIHYRVYLSDLEFEDVAEALISKHPCLKDPGLVSGYGGWKAS